MSLARIRLTAGPYWQVGSSSAVWSSGGIGCGKTCRHGYADGTSVTLKAKSARGSKSARACQTDSGGSP